MRMQATVPTIATLPLSEVFGPTLQGEGPHTGRRCYFVRLGQCNLHCSWCDTPYTWDHRRYDVDAECPPTPVDQVHHRLADLGATRASTVVLSGGEPLIHHHRLQALLTPAHQWHVETNGTIPPPDWWPVAVAHTTVSPKVAQTDDPHGKRIKPKVLNAWAAMGSRVAFKFVVRATWSHPDLARVDNLVDALGLDPWQVWVMPEGTTPEAVLAGTRLLAQPVIDRGYNLTTRLHTLIWHDERGH